MELSKVFIGQTNRVFLTDANLSGENEYTVTLTVIDETGTVATDVSDSDLENVAATYDLSTKKYYYDLTFLATTSAGFFRLIWTVLNEDSLPVLLKDFNTPQTVQALKQSSYERELVPVAWFIDTFLDKIDIGSYSHDRIRDLIQNAQGALEILDVQTYFTPITITDEKHDYFYEKFGRTFWQTQLYNFPLISITDMKLKYGDTEVATIQDDFIMIDKEMGMLEILPSHAGHFYTLIASGLAGLAYNTLSGWDRIPMFFHFTYQAGLDWDNLTNSEKMSIRTAIGRKAAIDLLPKIDSRMGISSESKSIDGVSKSTSYTSSAMYGQYSAQIEQYQKDHADWVVNFRRKYNKNIFVSIA